MKGFNYLKKHIFSFNKKSAKSFTLIEALITLVVSSFIMAGLYSVVVIANNSYSTDSVLVYLGQQTRQVAFWITKDIREASSISINQDEGVVEFEAIFDTDGSRDTVRYYRQDNQIIREEPNGVERVVGNDIIGFDSYIEDNMLYVDLSAEKEARPGQFLSFSLRERVRLRNE